MSNIESSIFSFEFIRVICMGQTMSHSKNEYCNNIAIASPSNAKPKPKISKYRTY